MQTPSPPAATRSVVVDGGKGVAIVRGERVVVRLAPDGGVSVVSDDKIDVASVKAPHLQPGGGKLDPADAPILVDTAAPGTVAFTLGGVAATGSLLRVENGTGGHIGYHAVMLTVRDGKVVQSRTTVCSVLAHIVDVEQWREPVVTLVALDFASRAGGAPTCGL